MASYPSVTFANNETSPTFNLNTFQTKTSQSDNIITSTLTVLGPSNLNTLKTNSIVNSGTTTCNNGLSVTGGTVSFVTNAIPIASVNGANTRITTAETNIIKLQNATSGTATNGTITTNILTIDYNANNNSSIIVTPTANFSVVITNVPTTSLYAIYTFQLFINAKFYCNSITVNGTSLSMTAVGGFVNIASQVNASATGLIQSFSILFVNSTIPSKVNTILNSTW